MIRVALFLLLAVAALAQDKSLWQPYYVWPREGAQHLDLSRDWELTDREKELANGESIPSDSKWRKVQRPTSVQMALHKAGELPHPYEHLNSDKYKWVDEKVWYYRKTFTAPAAHDGYAYLYFHGIDYFARVWLNGKPLGRHEGMFGGPALEVSKELKPGSPNELLVEVRAGNYGNKAGYKPRDPGRIIKPWVIAGGTGGEMFFPLGMWQGVRLDLVPRTHLDRPFLRTISASDREARLHVSVEILRDAHSLEQEFHPTGNVQMRYYRDWWKLKDQQRPMAVVFELADRASKKVVHRKPMNVSVVPGRNWLESEVTIPDPKLWWPNGMGDAHLYRARLILQDGANEIDRIELDYGIRTLQTERTPGPRMTDRWSDWQFVVNGRKFFVKGMNWMPADILLDLPRERYHWLLSAAKNAGIQMLRVWGGGIIEPEAFYEVANELGILVWQDFPIGNMFTPLYPQPVWEAQVMHTIYRLRNHPSLAVWCGGNEFNPYAEGNAASIGILERSLADFDGTRPFRRTSPDNGSMHDYPDMDPTWYSRKFPYLPYMAETGMHNIPSARTLREVISPAELAKPVERMYDPSFEKNFPELRHHFVEYQPTRVPRSGPASSIRSCPKRFKPTTPSLRDSCRGCSSAHGLSSRSRRSMVSAIPPRPTTF
jgi:beta-mannosidase